MVNQAKRDITKCQIQVDTVQLINKQINFYLKVPVVDIVPPLRNVVGREIRDRVDYG